MRSRRSLATLLMSASVVAAVYVPTTSASAIDGDVGSCTTDLVQYPDGSADLTNPVNASIGEDFYDAGCVTVHSVPGKSLTFTSATTFPGWSYRVKEAGGTKKLKVVVTFESASAGVRINYTIQPGRVDWRISQL